MSDLRLTEAGNAGFVSELERKRIEAVERRAALKIKPIEKRRSWSDKREES